MAAQAIKPRFAIEFEYLSEDEIEEYLAELLVAYRAFYLDPDEAEPPQPRDPATARKSRYIFKSTFRDQLSSAEDEEFLLQEEEEDVLDVFMTWVRARQIPSGIRKETFGSLSECLEHVDKLRGEMAPFTKRIL